MTDVMATEESTTRLPVLDLQGSAGRIAENWKRWKRAFQYYVDGKGINSPERQRSLLLHHAGMQVQDIFEDLTDPRADNPPDGDTVYTKTIRMLDTHFEVPPNVPFERHLFRQLTFNGGETVSQFAVRLRQQARYCQFGVHVDEHIRDQLLDRLPDQSLKTKLLQETDLSLEKTLRMARTWETAGMQAGKMTASVSCSAGASVNAVQPKKLPRGQRSAGQHSQAASLPRRECFNCGRAGHKANDDACPAKGKSCHKCGKSGHFSKKCRAKATSKKEDGDRRRRSANMVSGSLWDDAEDSGSEGHAFVVTSLDAVRDGDGLGRGEPVVDLDFGCTTWPALIDSGACSNVMGENEFLQLQHEGLEVGNLQHCSKRLYGYGGASLNVKGKFDAVVSFNGAETSTEFIVVAGDGRCLLGRDSARALHLLTTGPSKATNDEVHAVSDATTSASGKFAESLRARFPACFNGVGKLRDYQLKLHRDTSVVPVAQKARRLPFTLRTAVQEKVKDLIAQDIIEPVEGPTTWCSPIVVTPKPSGDIRLCVDMRRANEAIQRERLPIPTVDEALETVNGSAVFSKLDFCMGFHQVKLAEESRDLTTFVTPDGLFRYKRLSFGVNSAPEKFQHIVREVLAGCDGVVNIHDDIIVHGQDEAEHDRCLIAVLERLQERGLTLNPAKCAFRLPKVRFMGLVLSRSGIGPASEKVKAIVEAEAPSTAPEVRSFLGLVGFNSRFIPDFSTVTEPLRAVSRKGAVFEWGPAQEDAFRTLKQRIADATSLAYFRQGAPTKLITDASPVGLGAVLVQTQGGTDRALCYASRTLSDVERRYSQVEKEALAVVWACERFDLYLFGLPKFQLITDNKAVQFLFSPRSKPSARIERWVLRLMNYQYEVVHVPSAKNIADSLSRLSGKCRATSSVKNEDDQYIRAVAQHAVPAALSVQDIEDASADDEDLQVVRSCLKSGNWNDCPRDYVAVRHELTRAGSCSVRVYRRRV